MTTALKKGDKGPNVKELQRLLVKRGYRIDIDGDFGTQTHQAVRAFQAQNLDQHGQPLTVDGKVGSLTLWSLQHRKPDIETVSAVDFCKMPPSKAGGSRAGRAALKIAVEELKAGACEIGGNNKGPFVKKYLAGAGLNEGNAWCASFVSWCFLHGFAADDIGKMPFSYSPSARQLLRIYQNKGWSHAPQSGYEPTPGDLVFWWRVKLAGWQGHVGFVHQLHDGMLYTIEGNRSHKVQGFSYVFSRMDKLLGFGRVEDE